MRSQLTPPGNPLILNTLFKEAGHHSLYDCMNQQHTASHL